MFMLILLLLFFAPLQTTLAAPLSAQNAIATLTIDNLKALLQWIYDFINPVHTPSAIQAITTCTVVIVVSAVTAEPVMLRLKDSTRLEALITRLHDLVYGFFVPDYLAITSWTRNIVEANPTIIFDNVFNKKASREYKWNRVHSAFASHGGFVLWEDNKSPRVLTIADITNLVKSGEIDVPRLSQKDIFARSVRTSRHGALLFALVYLWFIAKFKLVLPALWYIAVTHGLLRMVSYSLGLPVIIAVKEPVIVVRKYPMVEMEEIANNQAIDKQDSEIPKQDVKVLVGGEGHTPEPLAKTEEPGGEAQRVPASEEPKIHILWHICIHVYVEPLQIIRAITSPLRIQWEIIAECKHSIKYSFYTASTITTLLCWINFYGLNDNVVFPSQAEGRIFRVSALFMGLQPLILLCAPRWIRRRIWGIVKSLFWIIYNLAYAAARVSVFVIAFHSIKMAL
ncbi:hypothetical protein NP233_g6258 [Leucocoprinus birnbaumii]|uniref:Uncharacterized protein n=1 Tax=Leucocoprinus birnbaumii TaxID=56174 RepID=A0AAD5VRH2_9AGAR|nr:hypothetical protein NP233_g6258 [Leucocoprinus birnbaumii]